MLKKSLSLLLALALVLIPSLAAAEDDSAKEELLEEYMENIEETDRSFTIPISFGILQAITLQKDGVGISFKTFTNLVTATGLEIVSIATDLKQIDIHLSDGHLVSFPAVVQIKQNDDFGTYIKINISKKAAKSIADLVQSKAPIVQITFTQNSGAKQSMTVDELNKALSEVFGGTVDIVNQGASAVAAFWEKLSQGAGTFYSNAYDSVESALVQAGDFIANTASDVGQALTDAASTAGSAVSDAIGTTGDFVGDAADTVSNFWNGLWGK